MKRFLQTTAGGLILALSSSAASARGAQIQAGGFQIEASLGPQAQDLRLKLTETSEVPSSCDSYVSSQQYLASLGTLALEIRRNECHVDRIGKNSAVAQWQLPTRVRSQRRIQLVVDDQKIGTIQWSADGVASFESSTAPEQSH